MSATATPVSTVLAPAAPWPFPPIQRSDVAERMAREATAACAPRKAVAIPAAKESADAEARTYVAGAWPFSGSDCDDPSGPVSGHLWGCALDEHRPVEPQDKALSLALTLYAGADEQGLRAMGLENQSMLLMFVALWAQDMGL